MHDTRAPDMIRYFDLDDHREMEIWDAFVLSHAKGLPFHLSIWLRTIRDTYGYKPLLCAYLDDSSCLRAIAPFFFVRRLLGGMCLVCVPFSDYCAPLASDASSSRMITDHVFSRAESDRLNVEIRGAIEEDRFVKHSHFSHHVLRLASDPEEVKKRIDKRTILYSIRKARRSGVAIVRENTRKGMEEFKKLNLLTRKKHGLPPQPRRFFEFFHDGMVATGRADVLLAFLGERAIAAGVFIRHNDTVHFKYSASDANFIASTTPNHLLTWTAIERSCREGYRCFDFGRTNCTNEGLARYKEMWGAVSSGLSYSYYPAFRGSGVNWEGKVLYRFLTSLMRKMPDRLLQRISDFLYKFSG